MPKAKSSPAPESPPTTKAEVVPYLERAMERRAQVALERQEAEEQEAKRQEAARAEAAKTAPQNPVPPKITAASVLEAFPHHMKIARERRLTELARKHPEIASAIQNRS